MACGSGAHSKGRDRLEPGDLPAFGRPAVLVWLKRRWRCPAQVCLSGSWTEERPEIVGARCGLTRRAGLWAVGQVGRQGHSVAAVAGEVGVSWHAVTSAVHVYGRPLVEDFDRTVEVSMLGVDAPGSSRPPRRRAPRFASAVVDIAPPKVLDLLEGRSSPQLDRWLTARPRALEGRHRSHGVRPARAVPGRAGQTLPQRARRGDPFHVVGVATRALDEARRRPPTRASGHRGRNADPLYRARKLLTLAAERLDAAGETKLRGQLAAGDPHGHVATTYTAKEYPRDLYTLTEQPDLAATWLDGLIEDCADSGAHLLGQ